MENWKDITKEEDWASKEGLFPLFLMDWHTLMLDIVLEFLNTFVIKDIKIYFGHKDKVYIINRQLIVDVFGVCADGNVEELK
jgi:hypothetical protein